MDTLNSPSSPGSEQEKLDSSQDFSFSLPDEGAVKAQRRSRTNLKQMWLALGGVAVALSGALAGLVLVAMPQDIRNQAFTGFTSRFGGGETQVETPLQFAKPGDFILNSDLKAQPTQQGAFFTLSERFQNDSAVEYQEVSIPEYGVVGRAYYRYEAGTNTSHLFVRIFGMPEENLGEQARMWYQDASGNQKLLGDAELEVETDGVVWYSTYTGPGDLRAAGAKLLFTYDTRETDTTQKPGFNLLSISF